LSRSGGTSLVGARGFCSSNSSDGTSQLIIDRMSELQMSGNALFGKVKSPQKPHVL
jgi:hypothetical protein